MFVVPFSTVSMRYMSTDQTPRIFIHYPFDDAITLEPRDLETNETSSTSFTSDVDEKDSVDRVNQVKNVRTKMIVLKKQVNAIKQSNDDISSTTMTTTKMTTKSPERKIKNVRCTPEFIATISALKTGINDSRKKVIALSNDNNEEKMLLLKLAVDAYVKKLTKFASIYNDNVALADSSPELTSRLEVMRSWREFKWVNDNTVRHSSIECESMLARFMLASIELVELKQWFSSRVLTSDIALVGTENMRWYVENVTVVFDSEKRRENEKEYVSRLLSSFFKKTTNVVSSEFIEKMRAMGRLVYVFESTFLRHFSQSKCRSCSTNNVDTINFYTSLKTHCEKYIAFLKTSIFSLRCIMFYVKCGEMALETTDERKKATCFLSAIEHVCAYASYVYENEKNIQKSTASIFGMEAFFFGKTCSQCLRIDPRSSKKPSVTIETEIGHMIAFLDVFSRVRTSTPATFDKTIRVAFDTASKTNDTIAREHVPKGEFIYTQHWMSTFVKEYGAHLEIRNDLKIFQISADASVSPSPSSTLETIRRRSSAKETTSENPVKNARDAPDKWSLLGAGFVLLLSLDNNNLNDDIEKKASVARVGEMMFSRKEATTIWENPSNDDLLKKKICEFIMTIHRLENGCDK